MGVNGEVIGLLLTVGGLVEKEKSNSCLDSYFSGLFSLGMHSLALLLCNYF